MEISASDDSFRFNTLAPGPSVALVSQDVIDMTNFTLVRVDYLVSRCQAHLAGERRVRFSVINIVRVRGQQKYSTDIIFVHLCKSSKEKRNTVNNFLPFYLTR